MNKIVINNEILDNEFDRHIRQTRNKRIIVSGKFGVGKSTFLNNYFESQNYNLFKISPIKYAVGSNEDIFEYIKFEIVSQLCMNYLKPEDKTKVPESLFVWSYINNNFSPILDKFIEIVLKLEPTSEIAIKAVRNLSKLFTGYKEHKKQLSEKDQSEAYYFQNTLKNRMNKIGSIFEDDFITQSIRSYLLTLKEEQSNILLIDDFDRMDPEHIFRILNVLSAHQDYLGQEGENKFGFDRIIIVCDIDTIQGIYNHKYGPSANFDGYISKFCSSRIFRFSNINQIRKFCEEGMVGILENEDDKITLFVLLNYFVDSGVLTLRDLLKYNFERLIVPSDIPNIYSIDRTKFCATCRYFDTDEIFVGESFYKFFKILSVLVNIFGDFDKLHKLIKSLSNSDTKIFLNQNQLESLIRSLGPFYHWVGSNGRTIPFCFNYDDNSRHGRPEIHLKYPMFRIFKIDVQFELKWNKYEIYDGTKNYFENMSLNIMNYSNNDGGTINLFKELFQIFEFLKHKGFSNKL